MPFIIPLEQAEKNFPQYTFISALTPSEQKAAFQVRDETNVDLCLKIISPDYEIDRLHREILALRNLNHANIVKLYEYTFSTTSKGTFHYMIEEFIPGHDLSKDFTTGQAWDRSRVSDFFAALCDGLASLEEHQIVHRDLKPGNIRVKTTGEPIIIDFGLARHLQLSDLTKTSIGAGLGTPAYFAPEQFIGSKHDIDHRTDIFAVGILLYQALVGCHPFFVPGMTYQQICDEVCLSNSFTQNKGYQALPPKWRLLVSRMLEKERFKRPTLSSQVGQILRNLRGNS